MGYDEIGFKIRNHVRRDYSMFVYSRADPILSAWLEMK